MDNCNGYTWTMKRERFMVLPVEIVEKLDLIEGETWMEALSYLLDVESMNGVSSLLNLQLDQLELERKEKRLGKIKKRRKSISCPMGF